MESNDQRPCLHVVPERVAREHVGDDFDRRRKDAGDREARLREFEARLQKDEGLQKRLRDSPFPTLREHGLVQPEDVVELTLGGYGLPDFKQFPELPEIPNFPEPICYPVIDVVQEWVCFPWGTHNLQICYLRWRIIVRWICH